MDINRFCKDLLKYFQIFCKIKRLSRSTSNNVPDLNHRPNIVILYAFRNMIVVLIDRALFPRGCHFCWKLLFCFIIFLTPLDYLNFNQNDDNVFFVHRLITNQARFRITMKKRMSDCAILGCRYLTETENLPETENLTLFLIYILLLSIPSVKWVRSKINYYQSTPFLERNGYYTCEYLYDT
jgi:hypothetical protein